MRVSIQRKKQEEAQLVCNDENEIPQVRKTMTRKRKGEAAVRTTDTRTRTKANARAQRRAM
jgi:hypothetical protein